MQKLKKIALAGCSDARSYAQKPQVEELCAVLNALGVQVVQSRFLYAENSPFAGSGADRAGELMRFYRDDSVDAVMDISGGDLANEVLEHLDFDCIAHAQKLFWGYSDLTTILNAIYARTGRPSVLYTAMNLVRQEAAVQQQRFAAAQQGSAALFSPAYRFVQGSAMQGVVLGGNIRCFLKLAGTPYFPDLTGAVLLLEACGGSAAQMVTYLCQLKQLGVLQKISGVLLGTFLRLEEDPAAPPMETLVQRVFGTDIPIAKTTEIGHRDDSKAIVIGEYAAFRQE